MISLYLPDLQSGEIFGGVDEFYTLISGEEVRIERGFIDLTSLAVLEGYKFQ